MTALIRSELLKYRSTRLFWGMLVGMFLTGAVFAAVGAAFTIYGQMPVGGETVDMRTMVPDETLVRQTYTGGVQLGYLLTLVIGVLSIGQEFRHKTATGTFLAAPRRSRVIGAKVISLIIIGAVNGVVHLAGAMIGGGALLVANDIPLFPGPAGLVRTLALALLVLGLWALLGLGIGVLIPNQIAALLVAIAFAWIVEPLLGFGLSLLEWGSGVARFFPSQATTAALDTFGGMDAAAAEQMGASGDQLTWWVGALVLLGYAALMTAIGTWLTRRRDIV